MGGAHLVGKKDVYLHTFEQTLRAGTEAMKAKMSFLFCQAVDLQVPAVIFQGVSGG